MDLSEKDQEKIRKLIESKQDIIKVPDSELSDYIIQVLISNENANYKDSSFKEDVIENLNEFFQEQTEDVVGEILDILQNDSDDEDDDSDNNGGGNYQNNNNRDDDQLNNQSDDDDDLDISNSFQQEKKRSMGNDDSGDDEEKETHWKNNENKKNKSSSQKDDNMNNNEQMNNNNNYNRNNNNKFNNNNRRNFNNNNNKRNYNNNRFPNNNNQMVPMMNLLNPMQPLGGGQQPNLLTPNLMQPIATNPIVPDVQGGGMMENIQKMQMLLTMNQQLMMQQPQQQQNQNQTKNQNTGGEQQQQNSAQNNSTNGSKVAYDPLADINNNTSSSNTQQTQNINNNSAQVQMQNFLGGQGNPNFLSGVNNNNNNNNNINNRNRNNQNNNNNGQNNNNSQNKPLHIRFKNEKKDMVFVKNLPRYYNTVVTLSEQFSTCGAISEIKSFQSEKAAMIKFFQKTSIDKALALNGKLLSDPKIIVSLSADISEVQKELPIKKNNSNIQKEGDEDSNNNAEVPPRKYHQQNPAGQEQQPSSGMGRGSFMMGRGRGRGRGMMYENSYSQQQQQLQQSDEKVGNSRKVSQDENNNKKVYPQNKEKQPYVAPVIQKTVPNVQKQQKLIFESSKKQLLMKLTDKFRVMLFLKNREANNETRKEELMGNVKAIMALKAQIEKVQDEEGLKQFRNHQLSGNDFDTQLLILDLTTEQANYSFLQKKCSEHGQVENLKINLKDKTAVLKYKDFAMTEKAFKNENDIKVCFNNNKIYEYLKEVDEERVNKAKELQKSKHQSQPQSQQQSSTQLQSTTSLNNIPENINQKQENSQKQEENNNVQKEEESNNNKKVDENIQNSEQKQQQQQQQPEKQQQKQQDEEEVDEEDNI